MNDIAKELFATRVLDKLTDLDQEQKKSVKQAILSEMDNYIVYTPEEAAEIIKEPLLMLEKFIGIKKREGLSNATLSLYKLMITGFIGSTVKKVVDITPEDIRDYLNKRVVDDGVSLSSANTIRSSLSTFFGWMFDEEFINRNPMHKVKPIRYEKLLQPAFTEIEIDVLRRTASNNRRNIALIDFLLSTGCRVSEVCSINISDVNFSGKKLRVIGKGNKQRIVYLNDVAVSTLKNYLRSRTDSNPALFVGLIEPHERMTKNGIQSILKTIGKFAHVENVHPHRFRHTCCTRLLCHGMELQDVSRILGHANVNTTMYYNNTTDEYIDHKFRQYSF